jgi:hypothetical protein
LSSISLSEVLVVVSVVPVGDANRQIELLHRFQAVFMMAAGWFAAVTTVAIVVTRKASNFMIATVVLESTWLVERVVTGTRRAVSEQVGTELGAEHLACTVFLASNARSFLGG